MEQYSRGEVSEITGIGFDAIRFYERKGLIQPQRGSSNNYRQFDEDAIVRLNFIKQSKTCGFTLSQIKNTLDLLDNPDICNTNSDEIIDMKIEEINNKIMELFKMKNMLESVKDPLRNKSCNQIIALDFNK